MPVIEAKFEDEFVRNKGLKRDDFDRLKEWVIMQQHLPPISDLLLAIFFHSCYYSNEATKTCIDTYYTARALCPEFFANRDPTSADLTESYKNACVISFKRPTNEGYVVGYGKLNIFKTEHFNLTPHLKTIDMALSLLHHQEGSKLGFIMVFDLTGITIGHVLRLNPLIIKKYLFFLQEALPVRLMGFHFINCVPFVDKIMAIIKPFMKKELVDMLKLHQPNSDTIFKYIPKECFLDESGGQAGPTKIVQAEYIQNFIDNKDYFIAEENNIADESKRQGRAKNAGDLFGVEGTFKKLDLD